MNLQHLKVLQALARHDSLQQAAVQLHKTQPALSMAIRKLEQECGFTIVDRSQYRLKLTAAGERFFQQSQLVLQQVEQLDSLSNHLSQGFEPSLRIAFDESVPMAAYLDALTEVRQQYPDTELTISADYRLLALEKLRHHQTDLVLTPWYPVFLSLGDFESVCVGAFDILLIAAPTLLPAVPLDVQQLAAVPQIIADVDSLNFNSGALTPIQSRYRIRVNNSMAMLQSLRAGLGWGMMPRYQVADALQQGDLQQLTIKDFPNTLSGEIHVVRQRNRLPGPVAQCLWQLWTEPRTSCSLALHDA